MNARLAELLSHADRLEKAGKHADADVVGSEALCIAQEIGAEATGTAYAALSEMLARRRPPDAERAISYAERALALSIEGGDDPDGLRGAAARERLAGTLIRVGRPRDAIKQLRVVDAFHSQWQGGPGSRRHRSVLVRLWRLALEAELLDDALRYAKRIADYQAQDHDGDFDYELHEMLGLTLLRAERPRDAIPHFERLLESRMKLDESKKREKSVATAEAEEWLFIARERSAESGQ